MSKMVKDVTYVYCDHCGDAVWMNIPDPLNPRQELELKAHKNYAQLPFDIASANKGESGTVCWECLAELENK